MYWCKYNILPCFNILNVANRTFRVHISGSHDISTGQCWFRLMTLNIKRTTKNRFIFNEQDIGYGGGQRKTIFQIIIESYIIELLFYYRIKLYYLTNLCVCIILTKKKEWETNFLIFLWFHRTTPIFLFMWWYSLEIGNHQK